MFSETKFSKGTSAFMDEMTLQIINYRHSKHEEYPCTWE